MEKLLHYCWRHRILPFSGLNTIDGRVVEVIDPGMLNTDAGPDFFNAKIRIDGEMWVGNIEIHERQQDWYAHKHDTDAAYDNVILHVVRKSEKNNAERTVITKNGRKIPELEIDVPEHVQRNYRELLERDTYPPCYQIIPTLPSLMAHSWMAALQVERLERKTLDVTNILHALNGDWEHAFFVVLARSFGLGNNSDSLEIWARHLPLNSVAHHRNDLFQVEAFFLGMAGMLDENILRERTKEKTLSDPYFQKLSAEYQYLRLKFRLSEPPQLTWKLLRMRPQNFPHIRIAQLAKLFHEESTSLSKLLACKHIKNVHELLAHGVSPYWETHYTFGNESQENRKLLSLASVSLIAINCVVPILFAYGRTMGDESYCDKALELLDSIKAEDNNITRMWQKVGLKVSNAGDSQALIQLKKQYCDRKDCFRCRFGYEYLKKQ